MCVPAKARRVKGVTSARLIAKVLPKYFRHTRLREQDNFDLIACRTKSAEAL